ncbi:AAA domain-containing protein [Williamsia sterculiae]|uniref:AAA domain-containing protein n=1 Tax=Williamsia sterculiae TaxID=1344003 RepID=A0A1N7HAR7_9NOCA|nr:AAA domain-containing protein [Williamsia sterculiae]
MEFLHEVVKARSTPILDTRKHLKTMPIQSDSITALLVDDASAGDVMLRVQRVDLDEPPRLPAILAGRVEGSIGNSSATLRLLEGESDVGPAYDRWISTWNAWAAADRARRPLANLRADLLWALQELQSRPESIELVVAAGRLRLPGGADWSVNIHVVTQSAVIERDDHSGDIVVRLDDESTPRLEDTQLFASASYFDGSGSRAINSALRDAVFSPIDPAIDGVLKDWSSRAITLKVEVNGGDDLDPSRCRLDTAPALIVRRRGDYALLDYYERIVQGLKDSGTEVPLGLAQLIEAFEPEQRIAALANVAAGSTSFTQPPLFPLPANEEQRQIIERLATDSGVVVEGPPGTGKTHTIANLVSALLARGQRVLVTSEKAQALRVLRDKLPPEMQELCISVTSGTPAEKSALKKSINEMATRKSGFNKAASMRRIDELVEDRGRALRKRAKLLSDIHALREAETVNNPEIAFGYQGTAAAIARQVAELQSRFEWMPESVLTDECPLSTDELLDLLELASTRSKSRIRRLNESLPDVAGLFPDADVLIRWCDDLVGAAPAEQGDGQSSALRALVDGADHEALDELKEGFSRLQDALVPIQHAPAQVGALANEVLSQRNEYSWSKTKALGGYLTNAIQADREVGAAQVTAPVVTAVATRAYLMLANTLATGEKWHGRFGKSPAQRGVENLGPIAQVDGEDAISAQSARIVAMHLTAHECLWSAEKLLVDLDYPLRRFESRTARINQLRNAVRDVASIDCLFDTAQVLNQRLRAKGLAALPLTSMKYVDSTVRGLGLVLAEERRRHARENLEQLASAVATTLGQANSAEAALLQPCILHGEYRYISHAREAYSAAQSEQAEERRYVALRDRMAAANPSLAEELTRRGAIELWRDRIAGLSAAWAWRRAAMWIAENIGGDAGVALNAQLDSTDREISFLTSQLAAAQAWYSCLQQMTAGHQQALQAYRDHVTNVGKGTGKHAERYRVAARAAMQEAQTAVPAWIMPIKEVLGSIPPQANIFDVVILDEASQVDITGIFLLSLAPRVIVVGDDMQCAPSEVSSGALEPIFERLDNYLPDVPIHLRQGFTPRSSIFTLLRSRFGTVIRLREHFRCMPEIINWSSNQFYRDAPLVPVRQFGADRLRPLCCVHVQDGYTDGSNQSIRNVPEAKAIVDQIEHCVADPAYAGKTFGVVVLQGTAQVDIINSELLQRLDPDERERRRIRVGNPPDFQGDERHVMFLSLVVAHETSFMSQTRTEMQRRYNVAASRAQDQMWLFHSVTPARLKEGDLRRSLLQYMLSTSPVPAPPMPQSVSRDSRHEQFDSLFEQRIFLEITARGYHVNPQVEVNSRRIDLVVTGAGGKLAVECDGDAWHSTPEQQRADLDRERELRRCGWEFWRVRESAYYIDPVSSMAGLWQALDARGIAPGGLEDYPAADDKVAWQPVGLPPDDGTTSMDDALDDISSGDARVEWPGDAEILNVESPPVAVVVETALPPSIAEEGSAVEEHPVLPAEVANAPEVPLQTSVGREGHYPLGAWEIVADSDLPQRSSHFAAAPSRADGLGGRHPDSILQLLVAAAWHREVTVERAMTISQLDEERTLALLADAEKAGKLARVTTKSGKTWIMAQSK